jgi:hypothetical protein
MTNLVQTWHFPSKDGNTLNVTWERYNLYHAAPAVNFTASVDHVILDACGSFIASSCTAELTKCCCSIAGAATYTVWLNYAQQGRPARLAMSDDRPTVVTGPGDQVVCCCPCACEHCMDCCASYDACKQQEVLEGLSTSTIACTESPSCRVWRAWI